MYELLEMVSTAIVFVMHLSNIHMHQQYHLLARYGYSGWTVAAPNTCKWKYSYQEIIYNCILFLLVGQLPLQTES